MRRFVLNATGSRPAVYVAVRTGTARDEPLVTLVHTPHKTHDSSIGTGDGVFDVRVGVPRFRRQGKAGVVEGKGRHPCIGMPFSVRR